MKNIIVPIDFSKESLCGLDVALLFAQKKHTNIQMVYVQKKSSDYSHFSVEEETVYAEKRFKAIIKNYTPRLKNESKLRYILKKGKIYAEIVSQAESYKNCIITLSTHGASGFEELFIGSNTFKIISATDLPVITLNKRECPANINKIVMPIDISTKTRQKVSYTARLAKQFNAEIHVLTVSSSRGKKILQRLEAYTNQVYGYLYGLNLKVHKNSVFGENITDITIEYSDSIKADLISIMTEQATSFSLFGGNYAHQMINKAEIPILSIFSKSLGPAGSFSTFGG